MRPVLPSAQPGWLAINEAGSSELWHPAENLHGVHSYLDAEYYLWSLKQAGLQLPKAIVINRPFEREQIRFFSKFLLADEFLSRIPLLFTNSHLDQATISSNEFKAFVDDVVMVKDATFQIGDDQLQAIKLLKVQAGHAHSNAIDEVKPVMSSFINVEKVAKRLFDIVFSSLFLLLTLPIMVLVAIAIALESKGGIFYVSERAGRGFKIFKFYKFRTMEVDADKKVKDFNELNQYSSDDATPTFFKLKNDPRVTKVGAFLRATSLDELPQLVNVLLGDMSIVGNRPLPIYEADGLTTNEYAERFMTYAGITGLWQIQKKEKPDMTSQERIGIDITYARSQTFLNDLLIILKTPAALLQQPNT
jgi:lipopolysaccharide/colanic/teichoic acid biosynthesis glycosyltransferase